MITKISQNKIPVRVRLYLIFRRLIIPFEIIEQYVPKNGNVVDVGCGYGIFTNLLALKAKKRNVVGIDIDQKKVTIANEIYGHNPNINFICSNITDTQLPNTDIITVIDVLHHIPSENLQSKLLNSCFLALSHGGKLIIKDLDIKPRWKYWFNLLHDFLMTKGKPVLYQNQNNVKNLLINAGFKLEKTIKILNYPYSHILYLAQKI